VRGKDVIAGLLTLLAVAGFAVAYVTWNMEGRIGLHGWIALGLGIVLTLALLAVLLALMFHSHRKGYDDDSGRP
jgi:cation transporter-like permease